jgi:hypothetical protein
MEIDDPKRENDRKESVDPICTKSNTDNVDPKKHCPNNDIDDPRRTNDRSDNEDPRLRKSMIDKEDPN